MTNIIMGVKKNLCICNHGLLLWMLIEKQPIKGDYPLFNIDVVSTHQLFILLLMSKKMYER